MRKVWLIARGILIEAVRRKEIYAIVLISTLLIGAVMTVNFFNVPGLNKFYREVALNMMSLATSLTVIVLAARQLPREFESRTIYPLLAKPISRTTFLAGKLLGIMLAAAFCFAIFMTIYVAGVVHLGGKMPWGLFAQYVYLQMLKLLILATLSFWLSMLVNLDAAITLTVVFMLASSILTSAFSYIYDFVSPIGQFVIKVLNYALPQLTLLDLSGKAVHAEVWDPLTFSIMIALTLYALFFASLYFGLSMLWFRRRAL